MAPITFLNDLERAADAHHLADTLHAAAEQPRHATEVFEIPVRDFDDGIIEAWRVCRAVTAWSACI